MKLTFLCFWLQEAAATEDRFISSEPQTYKRFTSSSSGVSVEREHYTAASAQSQHNTTGTRTTSQWNKTAPWSWFGREEEEEE